MILTDKIRSLSRSSVVALALAMSIMFGAGAALATRWVRKQPLISLIRQSSLQVPGIGCSMEGTFPR